MAQSTANAASSYAYDHSPDISLSRKMVDRDGTREGDGHYIPRHLSPKGKKYQVSSPTRTDHDHVTDLHIETSHMYPSSRCHPRIHSKVIPKTVDASQSGFNDKNDPSALLAHDTDISRFNQDTQHSNENRVGKDKSSLGASGRSEKGKNGDKNPPKGGQWKRLHRIVEQMDDEPCCIIIFKWLLIVVGLGMLVAVIEIMGEVMYAWFSGDLEDDLRASQRASASRTFLNITSTIKPTEINMVKQMNDSFESETTTDIYEGDG